MKNKISWEKLKKICKKLIFPHTVLAVLLVPVSAFLLIYSFIKLESSSLISIISYVFSAYTLTVLCVRIPQIIKFFKNIKEQNKYAQKWFSDAKLRMKVTLYFSFAVNSAYSVFQLCLGAYHKSFWYYSLAAYYFLLALVRFFLVSHTKKYGIGENICAELKKYRFCGIIFLIMNLTLTGIIFFMVYFGRTFEHHEITTIAMAAYTFTTFSVAIVNTVKYKKYNSPLYSAKGSVSLAASSVSMITLTSTMLNAFGDTENIFFNRTMLASAGGGVSVLIIVLAVYMIIRANKSLKQIK